MRFVPFFPFTQYSTIPTFQHSNWGEAPKFYFLLYFSNK